MRIRIFIASLIVLQLLVSNAVIGHAEAKAASHSTEAFALQHLGLTKGFIDQSPAAAAASSMNGSVDAQQLAAMHLNTLGYREELGDFYGAAALERMVELGILSVSQWNELKVNPFNCDQADLLTYQTLKAKTKNGRVSLAQRLAGQGMFSYEAAREAGLFTVGARQLLDHSGVQINRPAYGELNVIIRRDQLSSRLQPYSSVALKSYVIDTDVQKKEYMQAVKELQDGLFNYRQMLDAHSLSNETVNGQNQTAEESNRLPKLYRHYMLENEELLLKEDKQQRFAYILVFYDKYERPLFYSYAELPLLEDKLSTNPTIVALMYHHFSESEEELNSLIVHPDRLRDQLQALRAAGYASIRQQDLLAFLHSDDDRKLPEKSVLLTFDDGYESNYSLAYPIVAEEGFYATIYAITSNVGVQGRYSQRITWPQSREMYHSGYIEIQNHTYNAHYYGDIGHGKTGAATTSQLQIDNQLETRAQYMDRMREDLAKSKQLIEQQVGNKVFTFAYPYGRNNKALIDISLDTGHSLMYTVIEGVIYKGANPSLLPRINVDGEFTGEMLLKRIEKYTGLR